MNFFWVKSGLKIMRRVGYFMLTILLITYPTKSNATHISGADLTYTWVSGNTFELELTLYRDCSGITAPNSVSINYKSATCGYNLNVVLNKKPGTGQEITLPCNSSPTTCSGGISPGIQKYEYVGLVTLPAQCTDWVFGYSICCRNCAITTLTFSPPNCSGAPATYIEATLNNLIAPNNSSPIFSNLPVAFFCIGQPFHYNHGAYDANGDSIVYSFIPPRSAFGTNVTFAPGYSPTNPISSSPPLTLSSTGDIVLNPTASEVGVMAILVREYRGGILVGSVIRDMQVYTQPCSNRLPTASGVNGTNNYSIVACPEKPLSFTILSSDLDNGQIVSMEWNSGIANATFTTSNSNRPVGTFSWTPSLSDAQSQPYTFTILVKDNNCPTKGIQAYSYSVTVPFLSVSESTTDALCAGSATGSASAIATGTAPFQYSWTPGSLTGATINGIPAGIYSVTVTDRYGCTASDSKEVFAPPPLNTNILNVTNVYCRSGHDGTASITVSGGHPPYTYSWSPSGGSTASATGLAAGSYTVSIRDANNCIALANLTITEPSAIVASGSSTSATCGIANGSASISVSGGVQPYTYLWNANGETSATISNVLAGNYQVNITDAHSCTATMNISISNSAGPAVQISTLNHVSCTGGNNGSASLNVAGGTMPIRYQWSTSTANAPSVSGLSAGNHFVVVSDANNCSVSIPFTISEPPSLSLHGSTISTRCFGTTDGQATVVASGGSPPYTYSWSTGNSTSSTNTGLSSGTYIATVTDRYGCTKTHSFTIDSPQDLIGNVSNSSMVSCFGGHDGSGSIIATGGTAPYSYSWTPYGGNLESANNLDTGIYSVTIKDDNNCITSVNVPISQPPPLTISYSTTPAGCNLSNGSASVSVLGGTRPLNYLWNSGNATGSSLTNIPSGSYQVTVTDAKNCLKTTSIAVSNTNGPSVQLSSLDPVSCFGGNDGQATVAISTGTAPFTYHWSASSSQSSTATNLASGNHSVTVTDSNNCVTALSFNIAEPLLLSTYCSASDASCYGKNNGHASVSVNGGTAPYTYIWSNGQSDSSIFQLASATYMATVTDAKGCISTSTTIVHQPNAIILRTISTPVSCYGGQDGQAMVQCSGGTAGYNFNWSNGNNISTSTNLTAGNYTVTVTDANGCTETNLTTITEPAPIVTGFTKTDASCYNAQDGNASITINGGISPYSYHWSMTGGSGQSHSNLHAGNYLVDINDANGCPAKQWVQINEPDELQSSIQSTDVSCHGGNDGSASILVSGGTAPYQFNWNDGQTGSSITQISAGIHTVTVIDRLGCQMNKSVLTKEPSSLTLSITDPSIICIGQTAQLTVNASGGTSPYNFVWSNGVSGQTQQVSPSQTSIYSVRIVDSKGCMSDPESAVVRVYAQLLAVTAGADSICPGGMAFLSANGSGGNGGPYSYNWSNGSNQQQTSAQLDNSATFTVTIQDNCGSPAATASVNVFVFSNPDASFLPLPVSGCLPLRVPFNASNTNQNQLSHFWNFGDGNFSTEPKPVHVYQQPGEYTVSHLVTNSHNCSSEITVPQTATVFPTPLADFYSSPEVASVQSPIISFHNESKEAIIYAWDFGDEKGISNLTNPEHVYSDTGLFMVKLISENSHGCTDTIIKPVRIKGEFAIYIPSAFTPNRDGINETFFPLTIGAKEIQLVILDRWGLEIFHSSEQKTAWDGKKDGSDKPCQMDVYVYIVLASDMDGRQYRYTGRVSLIR